MRPGPPRARARMNRSGKDDDMNMRLREVLVPLLDGGQGRTGLKETSAYNAPKSKERGNHEIGGVDGQELRRERFVRRSVMLFLREWAGFMAQRKAHASSETRGRLPQDEPSRRARAARWRSRRRWGPSVCGRSFSGKLVTHGRRGGCAGAIWAASHVRPVPPLYHSSIRPAGRGRQKWKSAGPHKRSAVCTKKERGDTKAGTRVVAVWAP